MAEADSQRWGMFNFDLSGNGVGREASSQFRNRIGAVAHYVGTGSAGFHKNSEHFGGRGWQQRTGGDYLDGCGWNAASLGRIESRPDFCRVARGYSGRLAHARDHQS